MSSPDNILNLSAIEIDLCHLLDFVLRELGDPIVTQELFPDLAA